MMNMALFLLFTHSRLFSAVGIASIVMSYITSMSLQGVTNEQDYDAQNDAAEHPQDAM